MRIEKVFTTVCLLLLILNSCSKDEDALSGDSSSLKLPDVLVVSEANGNIYQTNISENGTAIFDFNLTGELNLTDEEYLLIFQNNLINLVSRQGLNYKVSQKNIDNSEIVMLSYICPLGPNEFGFRPIITDQRIAMVTLEDLIFEGLFKLKSYDIQNHSCEELNLGKQEVVGSVLVRNENVYLTQVESSESFIIRKIDLNSMRVDQEIKFSEVFKVSEKNGKLYVFFQDDTYKIFDSKTFEEISSGVFNFDYLPSPLGFFEMKLSGNLIATEIIYTQPSTVDRGPGIANIDNNEIVEGGDYFAEKLTQILSQTFSANIRLTTYDQDLESKIIIYGFDSGDIGGEGGIVFTNYNNEILKTVELNSVPSRIIIR